MMKAEDFRLRIDPGPEFSWHIRIWWQHSAHAMDGDLLHMREMVGNVHDVVAMHNP